MPKKLLCFGDSNTYGYRYYDRGRFDSDTRWTGILSKLLMPYGVNVIESGLNSRTTVFDYAAKPDKNGSKVLPNILKETCPDYVIIMLGTNDCKTEFHATPDMIVNGLDIIVKQVKHFDSRIKIILVCPAFIDKTVLSHSFSDSFDENSILRSAMLENMIRSLADENECIFLSAAGVADTSHTDGIHLNEKGHAALAKTLFECILEKLL